MLESNLEKEGPEIDAKKASASVERLVRGHTFGTVPAEGTLDTPEKMRGYVERMKGATRDRLEKNRRAREQSAARSRSRRVV